MSACCLWVSNRHRAPKHKMRIKAWYFRIQQNSAIFVQVYVTHFEYWLLSKFSHLTARLNKSHPGGEIFRIWTRENNILFPVKRENNGKTIFIWTAPKIVISPFNNSWDFYLNIVATIHFLLNVCNTSYIFHRIDIAG